jgi:hypothetical protein
MWATLHAFEHNNLDRMTQTRAPKYGHTLLRSRARKTSISYYVVEEQRQNPVGFMFEPDGLSEPSIFRASSMAAPQSFGFET